MEINAAGLCRRGRERSKTRSVGNNGDAVAAGQTVGGKAGDGRREFFKRRNERCACALDKCCEGALAACVCAHLETGDSVGGVARTAARF